MLTSALLVLVFLAFAWANFATWRRTGHPSGLGATILEAWTAALFLLRRPPREVSTKWLAWIAAPIGTFTMLLSRPIGSPSDLQTLVGESLQFLGAFLVLVSVGTLGRSFGLVAANRGVKVAGPYRIVRHPAYASYLVAWLGYLVENPSPANVALLVLALAFQLVRIEQEESVLVSDAEYRDYRAGVRFRLVPYVY
jgi:protein-S-isoprenylcysteine O-methyltransferase Ste14